EAVAEMAEMHVRGRRHRDLGAARRAAGEERVVLGDDRMLLLQFADGDRRRLRRGDALVVVEGELRGLEAESLDRGEEPARPAAAAEFAVGDEGEAESFLKLHDVADRLVLRLLQLRRRDLLLLLGDPRLGQRGRAQEAAD